MDVRAIDVGALLYDDEFLRRLRGEYALQFVNGAGVQETAGLPECFREVIIAFVESVEWHEFEIRKAA